MSKYKTGKIYRIYCDGSNKYYIGSTIHSLEIRLSGHKNSKNICSSKELVNNSKYDIKIELLENYPCNNRNELLLRETEWIKKNIQNVVNKEMPNIKEDNINNSTSGYYRCDCGSIIKNNNKYHSKTNKHKNKINNKINSNQTINKNYGYRGYFKCECGSLIKNNNNRKMRHNETKKHYYYLKENNLIDKIDNNKNKIVKNKNIINNNNKNINYGYYKCECGSLIKNKGKMQHIETEKHKNYINNKINKKINSNQTINKNYGYRGYFKCECGSLIKNNNNRKMRHNETKKHYYYLKENNLIDKIDNNKNKIVKNKNIINNNNKNINYGYYKCECGSLIKNKSKK